MNDKALDEAIAALSSQLALANAVRDVLPFMRDAAGTGCSERFDGRICICLRCRARDWLREHEFTAARLPHPARGDDGGGK